MKWLDRLLGVSDEAPEHVQQAIEAAADVKVATTEAKWAMRRYWRARHASDDANKVILDAYTEAEAERNAR